MKLFYRIVLAVVCAIAQLVVMCFGALIAAELLLIHTLDPLSITVCIVIGASVFAVTKRLEKKIEALGETEEVEVKPWELE